jgi:hypothetical protein
MRGVCLRDQLQELMITEQRISKKDRARDLHRIGRQQENKVCGSRAVVRKPLSEPGAHLAGHVWRKCQKDFLNQVTLSRAQVRPLNAVERRDGKVDLIARGFTRMCGKPAQGRHVAHLIPGQSHAKTPVSRRRNPRKKSVNSVLR